MQLAGRVAVVAGAAGGIGKEICARCVRKGSESWPPTSTSRTTLDAGIEEFRTEVAGRHRRPRRRHEARVGRVVASARHSTPTAPFTSCATTPHGQHGVGNVWEQEQLEMVARVHLFGVVNGARDVRAVAARPAGGSSTRYLEVWCLPELRRWRRLRSWRMPTRTRRRRLRTIGASLYLPFGCAPRLLNAGIWNESVGHPPSFTRSTPRPLRSRPRRLGRSACATAGRRSSSRRADQVTTGILEAGSGCSHRQAHRDPNAGGVDDPSRPTDYMLPDQ